MKILYFVVGIIDIVLVVVFMQYVVKMCKYTYYVNKCKKNKEYVEANKHEQNKNCDSNYEER